MPQVIDDGDRYRLGQYEFPASGIIWFSQVLFQQNSHGSVFTFDVRVNDCLDTKTGKVVDDSTLVCAFTSLEEAQRELTGITSAKPAPQPHFDAKTICRALELCCAGSD